MTSWHPMTRIAFRFCVIYFGVYCVLSTTIPFALFGVLGKWFRSHGGPWVVSLTDAGREVVGRIDAVRDPAPDVLTTLDDADLLTLRALLDKLAGG